VLLDIRFLIEHVTSPAWPWTARVVDGLLRSLGLGAALGFETAVGDAVGAYPYLISPVVLFGCQFLFTAWFVAVGWTLFRIHDQRREEHGAG
jgi:hypothetical protein